MQQPDDPSATFGYDVAGITERSITGTINPVLTLLSTRDNFADFLGGEERSLVLRWGSTAGSRVSLFMPRLRYSGATPGDVDGYAVDEVAFKAVGCDTGLYLCVY